MIKENKQHIINTYKRNSWFHLGVGEGFPGRELWIEIWTNVTYITEESEVVTALQAEGRRMRRWTESWAICLKWRVQTEITFLWLHILFPFITPHELWSRKKMGECRLQGHAASLLIASYVSLVNFIASLGFHSSIM